MPVLRLVIAWLVMAALPLQGLAAASMLYCGSQAAARVAQAAPHQGHHDAMETTGHDHASHEHVAAQPDEPRVASHAPCADAGSMESHACPVCATCSQAQAVGGFSALPFASPAPLAEPAQLPSRVSSRTLTPPDKPPRA